MTIVQLDKMTLYGAEKHQSRVLEQLQELGCVHLVNLGQSDHDGASDDVSIDAREALKYLRACPEQLRQVRRTDHFRREATVVEALRLKSELSAADGSGPAVWVAGYSNDVFAYVPSRRVLLEGGYEAGGAMIYMTTVLQPGAFAPTVEERIVEKVHELDQKLMPR